MIVKLKDKSFFVYNCSPGEYDIVIEKFPETKLHLKVEGGNTYYLRFGFRAVSMLSPYIRELILEDSDSIDMSIFKGTLSELHEKNAPLIRPKNRLGVNLNFGLGSNEIPFITTTTGDESSISFGGGLAYGIKFGHEFNRYFDLAFDLNHQTTKLNPKLSNATVLFDRSVFTVTPSFIIPILQGDMMRIKVGGGIGYYWHPVLTIESIDITDGFDDTWNYKSSFGYHFGASFELNFAYKWSLSYGVKWYYVNYEFKSSENQIPTINELSEPNGSGIDLQFGLYYHF